MLTPRDGSLTELLHRSAERVEVPSRTARFLGVLSVTGVMGFLGLLWFVSREPGAEWSMRIGNLFWAIMILSLGGIHVLAIFSQILSNGRNLLGAVSLVMLYAGAILLVIVDHLLR